MPITNLVPFWWVVVALICGVLSGVAVGTIGTLGVVGKAMKKAGLI